MAASARPPALGPSPFHTRGSTYLGVHAYAEARVPGGMAAARKLLPDDAHRAFLDQVFLPVSWYDALPIRAISIAVAAVEGISYADSVRARTHFIAQRDIKGLYKIVLRAVTPESALARLTRISARYFDFGHTEVIGSGPGRSEGQHVGVPAPLLPWFLPMIEGYCSAVLEIAGARSPKFRFEAPKRDGEKGGIETFTVRFAFLWS